MKIRKLKIKNYKIFDDVEFDFTDAEGKTLDTIVLAGVNGCGKTTVLEVIKQVISDAFEKFYSNIDNVKFEIVAEFDLSNLKEYEKNMLGLEYTEPYYTTLRQSRKNYINVNLLPGEVIYLPVSETTSKNPKIKILNLSRQRVEMKQIVLKSLRNSIFANKNRPPQIIIERRIQEIMDVLFDLHLNTHLSDLESEELVFKSANDQQIYFEELSHGEQHLYFRAIYLNQLNLKDSIIMIDEPEAAFHPTWQQKIAQLYQNVGENNQVFMATHSPHIMASVPPECLFMLHIDESEGKRKIQVINAAKAGKHSQGLEPDRILKEIMQVKTLRDYETQRDIDELTRLLTLESFESNRAVELAENLTAQLGREDPFIIRLEHQLLMLRRKKPDLAAA